MKITEKHKRWDCVLGELNTGACFLYDSILYIACESPTDNHVNRLCIRLKDGHALRMISSIEVEHVEAEVTYR